MKKLTTSILMLCLPAMLAAKDYYVATNGNDSHAGTKEAPFATLAKAQSVVQPGDTVYIRGGVYKPTNEDIMGWKNNLYHCVFLMDKSGESDERRICYFGYPGERPVFDLSDVYPESGRISVFFVSGSWLHFRNFDVTGTQVIPTKGNTQSECFSNRGGSHNIYENLAIHDGKGIGFYLTEGSDNLVLNCDAYNNYDDVSGADNEGAGNGGNVDGFGGHPAKGSTGNVFRGCRAWWNSDDGFDLIHSGEAVTIEHCWAFYNGYKPGTKQSAGDGNGIKAGGYGMNENSKIPDGDIPMHTVTNCIAYGNKAAGFYANHHLGGLRFCNNTACDNRWNYNMLNRRSREAAEDVPGYGHILRNNVAFRGREADIANINEAACEVINNSFLPAPLNVTEADFVSIDPEELTAARDADGNLPAIGFLVPANGSALADASMGYTFDAQDEEPVISGDDWLMEAAICIDGDSASIQGPGADEYNRFYINGESVSIRNGAVDLSGYTGTLHLKATSPTKGGVIKLTITR